MEDESDRGVLAIKPKLRPKKPSYENKISRYRAGTSKGGDRQRHCARGRKACWGRPGGCLGVPKSHSVKVRGKQRRNYAGRGLLFGGDARKNKNPPAHRKPGPALVGWSSRPGTHHKVGGPVFRKEQGKIRQRPARTCDNARGKNRQ